jgi:hypothetical protein
MPRFRVSGDIRRAFVVEVEAKTLEEAMDMVESGEVPRSKFSLAEEYQDGDTEAQDGEEIG